MVKKRSVFLTVDTVYLPDIIKKCWIFEGVVHGADSSVGRALPLQGKGRRFEPCSAYHIVQTIHVARRACNLTGFPVQAGGLVRQYNYKVTPIREWGRRSARLGRQIVNLEVAGSNPVGPAIHFVVAALTDTVSLHFSRYKLIVTSDVFNRPS